jgi:hypothetical protein
MASLGFEKLKTHGITTNSTEKINRDKQETKEYINIYVVQVLVTFLGFSFFIGKYSYSHKADFYTVPCCARPPSIVTVLAACNVCWKGPTVNPFKAKFYQQTPPIVLFIVLELSNS